MRSNNTRIRFRNFFMTYYERTLVVGNLKKGIEMEDNELFENDDVVETDAEVIDDDDEEVGGISPVAIFGAGTVVGILVHKFVVPVVGNALNSAREGLVKLLTKGQDYTEVEQKETETEKTDK